MGKGQETVRSGLMILAVSAPFPMEYPLGEELIAIGSDCGLTFLPHFADCGSGNNGKLISFNRIVSGCCFQVASFVVAEEHIRDDHAPDSFIGSMDFFGKIKKILTEGIKYFFLDFYAIGLEYFGKHFLDMFSGKIMNGKVALVDFFAVGIAAHVRFTPFLMLYCVFVFRV